MIPTGTSSSGKSVDVNNDFLILNIRCCSGVDARWGADAQRSYQIRCLVQRRCEIVQGPESELRGGKLCVQAPCILGSYSGS
jgi:hypothetical protein